MELLALAAIVAAFAVAIRWLFGGTDDEADEVERPAWVEWSDTLTDIWDDCH